VESEVRGPADVRWKWALLSLCALSFVATLAAAIDVFGLAARPWFGWWDANVAIAQPFTVVITQPRPLGASARSGLQAGDQIDLREQSLEARIAAVYQLMADRPTNLAVRRGPSSIPIRIVGSSIWEDAALWKLPPMGSWVLANLWFVLCAALIALRRWHNRDARTLAFVLLFTTGVVFEPTFVVVPSGAVAIVLLLGARSCATAASLLLVRLAAGFGERAGWRTALASVANLFILAGFLADLMLIAGLATLRVDPLPYLFRISPLKGALDVAVYSLVTATALAAVLAIPATRRPRAAWLLLPLPIAFLATVVFTTLATFIHSWFANVTVIGIAEAIRLLGALIVTYALLNRRVLDFEFVLSRTLVVATVSLIVVAAFVLLDWVLGNLLSNVSHATGLVANGALALALGLSLNAMQRRVHGFLDAVLFRKRHEDERALLEFSREAASATELGPLLDRAIEHLEHHTAARGAAIFVEQDVSYAAVRSFGNSVRALVAENDATILALKTWHKPLDPHRYITDVHGALALPMLERGRLNGVILLGERVGGEAYAPDEIEALSRFALGVGSAIAGLGGERDGSLASIHASLAAMSDAIAALRETLIVDRQADGA